MTYFSLPRAAVIGEVLLNGSVADTNDGTKVTYTGTNVTYADCPVGYQKQCGVFGATSNLTRASLASVQGFMAFIRPTANTKDLFQYVTGTAKLAIDASNNITQTGLTNSAIYVNGQASAALTLNAWNFVLVTHDSITAANWNFGVSSFLGSAAAVRTFNAKPSADDILRFWHEFNRKLGGGSDFGAVIPNPTAYLDAVGEDTFYDVSLATKATRTAGTVANDEFGISRAIAGPNQSWTSVSGDSFVYWNNSGWKLEKNVAAVTATGINTANTVRAVLYYPAGTVTAAQQTYLENCFKSGRYPYAFRRSILPSTLSKAKLYAPGYFNGTTVYNIADNTKNGTMVSTAETKIRAGQNDALAFPGAPSRVSFGDNFKYSVGTYMAWCKFPSVSVHRIIMGARYDGGGGTSWFGFYVRGASAQLWFLNIVSGSLTEVYGGTALTADKWFHCACVRNGTAVSLYLNGALVASGTVAALPSTTGIGFTIGSDNDGGANSASQGGDYFATDELLTQQEIQSHYFGTYRN